MVQVNQAWKLIHGVILYRVEQSLGHLLFPVSIWAYDSSYTVYGRSLSVLLVSFKRFVVFRISLENGTNQPNTGHMRNSGHMAGHLILSMTIIDIKITQYYR